MRNISQKLAVKRVILVMILLILPNAIIAWNIQETWEEVKKEVNEGRQTIQEGYKKSTETVEEGYKKGTKKIDESTKHIMENKIPEWKQDWTEGVEHSRQKIQAINQKIRAILPEFDTSGQGCGSGLSTQIVTDNWGIFDFTRACEQHDECYEQCNVTQRFCDNTFFYDLFAACPPKKTQWDKAKYKICEELVKIYWFTVAKAGQSAWQKSQESACQHPQK